MSTKFDKPIDILIVGIPESGKTLIANLIAIGLRGFGYKIVNVDSGNEYEITNLDLRKLNVDRTINIQTRDHLNI